MYLIIMNNISNFRVIRIKNGRFHRKNLDILTEILRHNFEKYGVVDRYFYTQRIWYMEIIVLDHISQNGAYLFNIRVTFINNRF